MLISFNILIPQWQDVDCSSDVKWSQMTTNVKWSSLSTSVFNNSFYRSTIRNIFIFRQRSREDHFVLLKRPNTTRLCRMWPCTSGRKRASRIDREQNVQLTTGDIQASFASDISARVGSADYQRIRRTTRTDARKTFGPHFGSLAPGQFPPRRNRLTLRTNRPLWNDTG